MEDNEKITILRERVNTLEEAFEAFLSVMEKTGQKRMTALAQALEAIEAGPVPDPILDFFTTYKQTTQERLPAIRALYDALTADFVTALVSSPDLTPEQEKKWLDLCKPTQSSASE